MNLSRQWTALLLSAWVSFASLAGAQSFGDASPAERIAPLKGPLPFVDISGVIRADLRRSTVERVLGQPREGGDSSLLHYPEQGLTFGLVESSAAAEAPVSWMRVEAPASAETFGGLRVGLAQAAAIEMIQQDYHVVERSFGTGAATLSPSDSLYKVRATDREQRTKREVEVIFGDGAVKSMRFTTLSTDSAQPHRARSKLPVQYQVIAVAAAAMALLAILSGRSIVSRRSLSPRPPSPRAGPWGAALVAIGMAIAALSWMSVREIEGWARVLAIAGFSLALLFGLVGLSIMTRSSSSAWSWPAKGLLTFLVLALLADRAGWFH